MKKFFSIFAIVTLITLIGYVGAVKAQQYNLAQLTQQSATTLTAAAVECTATGAGNTTVTCTLGPPPAGLYVYVTNCTAHQVANAAVTGAAGPAGVFTTTNLQTNLIWYADNATAGTGARTEAMKELWPNGLKTAAPGTSFTLAQTGGQSTQTMRINCAGYFAQ